MSPEVAIAALTLLAVLLILAGETALSVFNERLLRARGAVAPPEDPIALMMWVYPACFVLIAIEGAIWGPAPTRVLAGGLVVFGLSKALKMWVISTLGTRWTFRVLVIPGAAPVSHGPYALLRHPNYVAVIGELIGVAMTVGAPVSGTVAVLGYGALLRRKIAVEDRALGRQ